MGERRGEWERVPRSHRLTNVRSPWYVLPSKPRSCMRIVVTVLALAAAGCAGSARSASAPVQPITGPGELTPAAQARADSGRPPYTRADVKFMQGMIGHHAQAIVMARWAPTHGARAD